MTNNYHNDDADREAPYLWDMEPGNAMEAGTVITYDGDGGWRFSTDFQARMEKLGLGGLT